MARLELVETQPPLGLMASTNVPQATAHVVVANRLPAGPTKAQQQSESSDAAAVTCELGAPAPPSVEYWSRTANNQLRPATAESTSARGTQGNRTTEYYHRTKFRPDHRLSAALLELHLNAALE